jgi:hypothetical protein
MLRGVRKAQKLTPHNEPKTNTTRAGAYNAAGLAANRESQGSGFVASAATLASVQTLHWRC